MHVADIGPQPAAEAKTIDEQPKLDEAKLLGFRNLIPVTKPGSDVEESSHLAFTKHGVETVTL